MNEWAEKIKGLESKGMTLGEIAEAIGLHTSSVSDLKRGATKAPTGMAAVRLYKLHKRRCAAPRKSKSH